jgi:hypothetical protein
MLMASLALVPSLSPDATRTRKPNRRPGSCPSKVTQLRPATDPDTQVVARYFARHGWTALAAFEEGFPADLAAAMLMIEVPPS